MLTWFNELDRSVPPRTSKKGSIFVMQLLLFVLLICVNSQELLLATFYAPADTTCSLASTATRYFETQLLTRQCGAGYTYGSPIGASDYFMVNCSDPQSTIVYGNCYYPPCTDGWCDCPGSCQPYDRELTIENSVAGHSGPVAHLGECIFVENYWNEFFYALLNIGGFDALRTGTYGSSDHTFSTNVVFTCPGIGGCGADDYDDPDVCSSHGTCIGPDWCECDVFTESDEALRYQDSTCFDYECADGELMSGASCNGNGNCTAGDAPGAACECEYGYATESHCADFYCVDGGFPVCSGHGSCSAPFGACSCAPVDEFGGFDCSTFVCEDGNLTSDAAACNGRGFCTSGGGACECDDTASWGGPECALWRCEDGELYTADGVVCGGHGTCSTPLGACACEGDYAGFACGEFLCGDGELSTDTDNVCSGHGACTVLGGDCTCTDDYTGIYCAVAPTSFPLMYQIIVGVAAPVVVIVLLVVIVTVIILLFKCRGARPSGGKTPDVPVVEAAVEMHTEKEKSHSSSSSSNSSSDD